MSAVPAAGHADIAICSIVRDGMAYLEAYRRQLESLDLTEGLRWRLYIIEGDSRDGTATYLQQWARDDQRITVAHEPAGNATERQDRAARWARVCNACLDLVPQNSTHTHVLWLEADLCFPPELLRRLTAHAVDVVAPVIFLGGLFYDTWGFRDLRGRKWRNLPPFHPGYRPMQLIEMGSVGSCVLFRRAVLDAGVRMEGRYEDGLLVGMCNAARNAGFKVYADTGTAILHPVDRWEEQMWQPSAVQLVDRGGRPSSLALSQARKMGLEMNLPLLDSEHLLRAQAGLWRHLFALLDTHRITVEAKASFAPRKRYVLIVHAHEPTGALRARVLRRLLLFLLRKHRRWRPAPHASRWPFDWLLRGVFHCSSSITIEPGP